MTRNLATRWAAALSVGVALFGCEQLPTDANAALQSQLVLRTSQVSTGLQASFHRDAASTEGREKALGKQNGPVDPATISTVELKITRIALLTSGPVPEATDSTDKAGQRWVDLELDFNPDSTWFDLKTLAADSALGAVPESVTGEIRAIRIFFGEARVLFKDGSREALVIPRGKITIPTRDVVVNEGRDVAVVFEALSFGRIIRTGNGLLMTPIFVAHNGGPSKQKGSAGGRGKNKGENGRRKG